MTEETKRDHDDGSPSPPKPSHRFSLGGLLRSKSLLSSRRKSQAPPTTSSLSSINELNPVATEATASANLHRRKTITNVMGKLFRRKSYIPVPSGDPSTRSHRVSSYYMAGNRDDVDDPPLSMSTADGESSTADGTKLSRRKSCVELKSLERRTSSPITRGVANASCNEDLLWYFKAPTFQKVTQQATKVLESTRCALILLDRLYQGILTLTYEDLHFQATAFPNRLNFRLHYFEIVAVVPIKHFSSKGLQVATQEQSVKFVNIPNRDTILKTLTVNWLSACKMQLLPRDERGVSLQCMRASPSPNSGLSATCRCGGHYDLVLCERQLPGIPLSLCSFIFGGGLVGDRQESFASQFFAERESIVIKNAEWFRDNQGNLVRTLKMQIPNPREPSESIPYRNEQTVLREEADFMCVEAVMRPDQALKTQKLRVRWCITRQGRTTNVCDVVVSAMTESTSPGMPVDKHTEAWLMKIAIGDYSALLDAAQIRLQELQSKEGERFGEGGRSSFWRLVGYMREILFFSVTMKLREAKAKNPKVLLISIILLTGFIIFTLWERLSPPAIDTEYAQQFALGKFKEYTASKTSEELFKDIQGITQRLDELLAKLPAEH